MGSVRAEPDGLTGLRNKEDQAEQAPQQTDRDTQSKPTNHQLCDKKWEAKISLWQKTDDCVR